MTKISFKILFILIIFLIVQRTSYSQNNYPASGDASLLNNNLKIMDVNGKGILFFQSDYSRSAEIKVDLSAGKALGTGNSLILGVNNTYGPSYNQRILFKTAGESRVVIENDGFVGIGTLFPLANLHIIGNTHGGQIQFQQYTNTSRMGIRAYNDGTTGDKMLFYTDVNTSVFPMVLTKDGKVGIGTISPVAKLSVAGSIRATEIKVMTDISIPDYVFENDYNLRPLSEIERYVKENRHLPEIPSAAEVKKNGIDVAEMDALLLKKIEELTLYMIEFKKEMEMLKEENTNLKKEVSTLKADKN